VVVWRDDRTRICVNWNKGGPFTLHVPEPSRRDTLLVLEVPDGYATKEDAIRAAKRRIAQLEGRESDRAGARKKRATEAREVTPSAEPAMPWVKVTRDAKAYEAAIARGKEIGPIDHPRKVYDLLEAAMATEDQEVFVVVLLDVHQNLRGVAEVHRGGRSRVAV